MHRRFLFPLAAAVVGLVAISPVFAAEPSPSKAGSGPAKWPIAPAAVAAWAPAVPADSSRWTVSECSS